MDEHFYDNEFEKFLQQQAKHHRMYPSDAVWKGIHRQIHGHKRWPGLYFIAILMVAALTVCTVFIESEPIISGNQVPKPTTLVYNQLDPAEITDRTFRRIAATTTNNNLPEITADQTPAVEENTVSRSNEIAVAYDNSREQISFDPAYLESFRLFKPEYKPHTYDQQTTATTAQVVATNNNNTTAAELEAGETAVVETTTTLPADAFLEAQPEEAAAIAKLSARQKLSRWQFQFYISPSMNYRTIVDQKPLQAAFNGPVATNAGADAKKVIRYNPGMGVEVGMGALFSLNNRLRVKAGLQYNIRQFNIEAYAGTFEESKIALNRRGVTVDTMRAYTRYRSTGGYNEALLLNKYHQLSIPVGIEYSLLTSGRFGIHLGGSIQPTYTFSQSSYLLTTDYKSYADGRSMLRSWNVNSSLEASFSYKSRKNTEWKFGPQLRYQHLPTYSDPYPIKEYLVDYGFKIGFIKTIQ